LFQDSLVLLRICFFDSFQFLCAVASENVTVVVTDSLNAA
jgi:hypothetical protein